MNFRNATYISVSIIAMGLMLPTVAKAAPDPLIVTNLFGAQTNDEGNSGISVGEDILFGNITGNIHTMSGDGAAVDVGDVYYDFFNSGNLVADTAKAVIINGAIGGDFTNNGTISGEDDAVRIYGNVHGSVVNNGYINSLEDDGFQVGSWDSPADIGGSFINNGTINGDETGVKVWGDIDGAFVNNGNISGDDEKGVFIAGELGSFLNNGNIGGNDDGVRVLGNIEGDVTNNGYINSIDDDGFQVGSWNESASIGGNFLNNGTISGEDTGVKVWGSVDGSFTNAGTIIGRSDTGVYIYDNVGGGFFNSGNITGDDSGVYIGGDILSGGFHNTGNIVGQNDTAVYIGGDVTGGFTNSGNISGMSATGVYIDGDLEGGFVNYATGIIYGQNTGVWISGDVQGGFKNYGSIDGGTETGVYIGGDLNGGFLNTGTIVGDTGVSISGNVTGGFVNSGNITGETAYGVYVGYDVAGGFSNTGNISGGSTGVYISGNISDTGFYNSGNISGDTYGVYISYGINAGGFVNDGSIVASTEYGIYIDDEVNGGFVNNGIIQGIYSGLYLNGNLTGGFLNTGDIQSAADLGVYIDGNVTGGVVNTGNIEAQDSGIYVNGNLSGGFLNTGDIQSSAALGVDIDGNVTGGIENAGNISSVETGIYVYANVTGGFTNSGNITSTANYAVYIERDLDGFNNSGNLNSNAAGEYSAVYIGGNLTGDFINTGEMSIRAAGADYPAYSAYVDGNFTGNFTSTWGQGLGVENQANIMGKTVTAFINKYVEDGDTWTAIYSYTGTIEFDGADYYLGQRIADTSALVDVSVDQDLSDDSNLVLVASRNRITSVAGNAYGLGGALDTVIDGLEDGGGTDALNWQLIDILYAQGTAGSVQDALAAFSPDMRGGTTTAALNQQVLTNAINMRLMGGLNSAQQVASLGTNDQGIMPTADAPVEGGLHMWFQAILGAASISENDGIEGADVGTGGVAVGVDGNDGPFTLGGAFAYLHSTSNDSDNDFTVDSYMPAVYAKWQPDQWYLSGIISGGYHTVDQDRYNSYIDESYDASYNVGLGSVRGEIGWDFAVGSSATLTPFVAASYNYLWTDGYDEGDASFALDVDGANDSYGIFEAGGKATMEMGGLNLHAMAGYRWGGLDTSVDASLSSGLGFGTDLQSQLGGVFLDADVMYAVSESISLGVGYDGVFGEDVVANYGSIKVDWKF